MNDTEGKEKKSKSQVKRELLALQELGRELIAMPEKQLVELPLDEELRDAVIQAKRFKREALRRQIRHIGALLRHVDAEAVRRALEALKQPHRSEVKVFHQLEEWRDRLLQGDNELMTELCQRFPDIDHQHVRRLLRNAIKERERAKPPKSSRALFRYLADLVK